MAFIKKMLRSMMRSLALGARAVGIVPPERVFRHLYKKGPFSISLPENRGRLHLMSWGNKLENELFWGGWTAHEPTAIRWWGRVALEASCVLDIGANTGFFGLIAKALNPNATVHVFEPLARIAAFAQENRDVSGLDVSVFQMAVAEQEGKLPIFDPGGSNAYSASLDPEFIPGDKDRYLVTVTTIDAHCRAHNLSPDLIKIDVEGLEGRVLLGAREIIARKQAVFLCEWLSNSDAHDAARALLEENDYVCIDPDTGETTTLLSNREHSDRNILFFPQSQIEEFQKKGPLK